MKSNKFNKLAVFVLFQFLCGITGCAVGLVGIGAGVGALTYVNGQLQKTYEVDYHEAIQASIITLNSLKIPVTTKTSDELKTTIKATRPDETPVTIDIVRIEDDLTRIGVRTGTIGVWDKDVSQQIQNFINKELILSSSRNQVKLEPRRKKVVPKSLSPPADEKKSANGLESEFSQKTSQVAAENGSEKKEQNNPGDMADTTSENQDLIICFEYNSNELQVNGAEKLNRVTKMILRHPEATVTLNSYPDSSGKSEYNMLLSESRADSVRLYLVSKGINPDKITVVVHGATSVTSGREGMPLRKVQIEIDKVKLAE